MPKNYEVIITSTKHKLSGIVQEVQGADEITVHMEFNPLTVLWDLLCTMEKIDAPNASPRDIADFVPKENYEAHPFYLGHKVISTLSYSKRKSFFLVIDELNKMITTDRRLIESDFEIVKQFFQLKFTYKMELRKPIPKDDLGYVGEPEYHYLPLEYNYDYDFKKMLADNERLDHRFTYSCDSTADIIFSVLHYLTLFSYKFNQCEHCGKYIANMKFKRYCERKSPYEGYRKKTCKKAVDVIMSKIISRHNSIKTHLYKYYPNAASSFLNEYSALKIQKKSVENLKILEHITSSEYAKKNWYLPEYK